jgi:hypothetical protein
MDTAQTSAVEKTLAVELVKNQRILEHPELGNVLLKRPTLEDEATIGEYRRRSYQSDLKNPDVLSKAELEKIAIARGMWSSDLPSRIQELVTKTGQAMAVLEGTGFKSVADLITELQKKAGELKEQFPATEELDLQIKDAIQRLVDLDDIAFDDANLIEKHALNSNVSELLEEMKLLKNQIKILEQFIDDRRELSKLQNAQTELFVDSIESRAEREQEFATIYQCCLNAESRSPLWPSFAEMKRADQEHIAYLITEYSYFTNGITPEMQEMLQKYGFLQRLSDTTDGSDDTPVQPESKPDGEVTDEVRIDTLPVSESDPIAMTS